MLKKSTGKNSNIFIFLCMQKDKITYSTNMIREIILHGRNQGFWAIKIENVRSVIKRQTSQTTSDYEWLRVATGDYKRLQVTKKAASGE